MARDYGAAITALNTLQSNFAIVDAIRKSGRGMNQNAIPEMIEWCRKSGHEPSEFNKLNAIHVAGTKGKGSTSAFISSILCQYSSQGDNTSQKETTKKVGLYTSPHLRSVRERIQINNEPISEELFAKYFFEIWDRLEDYAAKHPPSQPQDETSDPPPPTKPVYFRYLTLMAFHTFLAEKVDTAVIECGIGGEYDSTNVLEAPSVTAVTNLGIDHTAVLGDTIEEIAWHKAGVFKPATQTQVAFTVDSQPPTALKVLLKRAEERGVTLYPISRLVEIENDTVKLGLAADFQKTNASLAVAVAAAHLRAHPPSTFAFNAALPDPKASAFEFAVLPIEFRRGLESATWGGRCETRRQGSVAWHLDGGHTTDSIRLAGNWFASSVLDSTATTNGTNHAARRAPRILLFNQQTRDARALASTLYTTLKETLPTVAASSAGDDAGTPPLFTHAIFCTNVTFAQAQSDAAGSGGRYKPDLVSMNTSASDVSALTVQKALAETWKELDRGAEVGVFGTIEEAIKSVRTIAKEYEESVGDAHKEDTVVLVTGSLHLVGGVLEVLDTI